MVTPVRRIVIWLASTVTVVVLLFGYHTSTNADPAVASGGAPVTSPAEPSTSPSSPAVPPETSSGSSTTEPSPGSSSPSPSTSPQKRAYTGAVAQTRWGPVQVQITVKSGRITAVDVVQQPSGNRRDIEINDEALPILIHSTLQAQSAQIDMVSGATVTSDGYAQSLQSALDQAGI